MTAALGASSLRANRACFAADVSPHGERNPAAMIQEMTVRHAFLFPTPHFPFLLEYCQGETGRSRRKHGLPQRREASPTLHLQRSRYGLAHTLALEPDRTPLSSR